DASAALAAMVKGASLPTASCNGYTNRKGLADYLAKGYCPIDGAGAPDGPTATTLEYTVADFAISRLAAALGDTANAATFGARGELEDGFPPVPARPRRHGLHGPPALPGPGRRARLPGDRSHVRRRLRGGQRRAVHLLRPPRHARPHHGAGGRRRGGRAARRV